MKALRYLLIVALISMTSVLSAANAAAQNLATRPDMQMQSTSGMVFSGSTLPSAAAEGTYVTGTTIGTYSPAGTSGSRRAKKDENPGGGFNPGGEPGPGDNSEPWEDPIGDAVLPLALLACVYALVRAFLKLIKGLED